MLFCQVCFAHCQLGINQCNVVMFYIYQGQAAKAAAAVVSVSEGEHQVMHLLQCM